MTRSERETLTRLWLAGEKAEVICAELGIHLSRMNRWRRRLGLTPRGRERTCPIQRQHLSPEQLRIAVINWKLGLDTTQIAIRLRRTEAAVYNSLSSWREQQHIINSNSARHPLRPDSGRLITSVEPAIPAGGLPHPIRKNANG